MFTLTYKGYYLHGYCDKPDIRIVKEGIGVVGGAVSLHAAKCLVTRIINANK